MNSCEWLDRIKEEFQLVSDYQLSKKLGIRTQRISNYRNNVSHIDDELAIKIENLLELPAGTVLLDMHAARSKCSQAAKILAKISKEIGAAAAAILLAVSTMYATVAPAPAQAEISDDSPIIYIMLNMVFVPKTMEYIKVS
ncbi:MAG: helix-turn-helix transcriptional regulator [Gammaproteobacteria bacterium]|nr:helix-turn-helix transcriptional regulator [Gammaproteobacteria bacterium]